MIMYLLIILQRLEPVSYTHLAPNGGAIGLSDSGSFRSGRAIVNWTDCSFTGNSAAGKGGAIADVYKRQCRRRPARSRAP